MTRIRRTPARGTRQPLEPAAFAERVMAAVRLETPPTPTRALITAVRRGSVRDAGASVGVAWHLATVRAWSIAPSVRVRSLALVLAVTLALLSTSLAAAGAVRLASEPVIALFGAHVDELGRLTPAPATVVEPANVEPDTTRGSEVVEHVDDDPPVLDDREADDQDDGDAADGADDEANDDDGEAEDDRDDAAEEATDAEDSADDEGDEADDEAEAPDDDGTPDDDSEGGSEGGD